MKRIGILLITLCLMLNSCSYNQFGAAATGSSLGGMFGSSIGGLMGGYRGHEIGTVAGMATGAAIGIAATSNHNKPAKAERDANDYVDYEDYEPAPSKKQHRSYNELGALQIEKIHFTDENQNYYLEPEEHASLVMAIYNRGNHTLYNIAPQVTCDNKRIMISPTAIVSELEPGQGFRYRAEVIASRKLKTGETVFQVAFDNGNEKITKKTFRIRTRE